MYNLLIVDDEIEILNYLVEVCREITKYELYVYRAHSGEIAADVLRMVRIDVLLSDIRMPGLDGLQLLDIARRETTHCKYILLTGYRNFDTVYQAVKNGDVRYVLKTETEETIQNHVIEAIDELETERKNTKLLEDAEKHMRRMAPFLQSEYIQALLDGKNSGRVTQELLDGYAIPLNAGQSVLPFLGRFDRFYPSLSRRTHNYAALEELLNKYMPAHLNLFFTLHGQYALCLVQPGGQEHGGVDLALRQIRRALEYTQEACLELTGETVSFAMGLAPAPLPELAGWYHALCGLLRKKIGIGQAMLVSTSTAKEPWSDEVPSDRSASRFEQLREYMKSGQKDKYFSQLEEILGAVRRQAADNDRQQLELYYNVAVILSGFINEYGLANKLQGTVDIDGLLRAERHPTWQAATQYLLDTSLAVFDLLHQMEKSRAEKVMETITRYIGQNLHEDLTLGKLSGLVHFNQSYLSRLFKQEMGKNLSEYILEQRIAKAKQLLRSTDLKINEISLKVGYQSPHSFSRMFRNITGVSPQDYRI